MELDFWSPVIAESWSRSGGWSDVIKNGTDYKNLGIIQTALLYSKSLGISISDFRTYLNSFFYFFYKIDLYDKSIGRFCDGSNSP